MIPLLVFLLYAVGLSIGLGRRGLPSRAVRPDEATPGSPSRMLIALEHKRYFAPSRILSEGTGNIVRAMEAHGVRRLVCETSLGIGDSAGRMGLYYTFFVIPLILPFYFWDKTRQERIIAASTVDWVIVRPGALTDGARRGHLRHGGGVGSFLWTVRVSRADVAEFMLGQLGSDRYLRAAPGVAWGRPPSSAGSSRQAP